MHRALWPSLLLILGFASHAAMAFPTPFHSPLDDGQPAAGGPLLPAGVHSIYMYLETGPMPSDTGAGEEICLNGSGDELCAWQVDVVATGSFDFLAFTPDPALAASLRWQLVSPTLLRINRTNATAGGDFGVVRIGELSVDVGTSGTAAVGASSQAASAALGSVAFDGDLIAVPEPGAFLRWVTGSLFLAAASRWRGRSARRRHSTASRARIR